MTRPDLSYALSVLNKYCVNPSSDHFNAVKRIFRYIKGTVTLGITLGNGRALPASMEGGQDHGVPSDTRSGKALACLGSPRDSPSS